MRILIKQTAVELLPVGEYPATIGNTESTEGLYGQQLKVSFKLAGPHQGKTLIAYCSPFFSPKSKLYRWVRAALGRDIPAGWDLESEKLLNRSVILVVIKKTGNDGSEFNRVDDVLPVRPTSPPAKAIDGGPSLTVTPMAAPLDGDDSPF